VLCTVFFFFTQPEFLLFEWVEQLQNKATALLLPPRPPWKNSVNYVFFWLWFFTERNFLSEISISEKVIFWIFLYCIFLVFSFFYWKVKKVKKDWES
jgi:hypothetical protein